MLAGFGYSMPTPSLLRWVTSWSGKPRTLLAMIFAFAGTTLHITTCANFQPRKAFGKESAVTSAVRRRRVGPSFSRDERANLVKELLLSIRRNSAEGIARM